MTHYFFSMIQKALQYKYAKCAGAKVLMFHQINNNREKWQEESIAISQDSFIRLISSFINKGYMFVSPEKLTPTEEHQVLITFDDVFADAYEYGMKYLCERDIPFCVFISDTYINQDGYISDIQLHELVKQKCCTVGYHSKNHKMMRRLKKEEMLAELDPREFEETYDVKIEEFAFPYGSFFAVTHKSISYAFRFGYDRVYLTISIPYSIEWARFHKTVPRINISEKNVRKKMESLIK